MVEGRITDRLLEGGRAPDGTYLKARGSGASQWVSDRMQRKNGTVGVPRLYAKRFSPNGRTALVMRYAFGGKRREFRLGYYGDRVEWVDPAPGPGERGHCSDTLDAATARSIVRRYNLLLDEFDTDPQDWHRTKLAEVHDQRWGDRGPTIREVCDQYKDNVLPTKAEATRRNWTYTIDRHLVPRLGDKHLADVSQSAVVGMLRAIRDDVGAPTCEGVRDCVRKVLDFAATEYWDAGYLQRNPAHHLPDDLSTQALRPPTDEAPRRLTPEEVKAIWDATHALNDPWGAWVRWYIIYGGAIRQGASRHVRWDHLRDDWTVLELPRGLPGMKRKGDQVPVPEAAQRELARLDGQRLGYVFSTTEGRKPISDMGGLKTKLDRLLGDSVDGWTFHDLRRTQKQVLEDHGPYERYLAEVLANRWVQRGAEASYGAYDPLAEKREALDKWLAWLRDHAGITLTPVANSANVVELPVQQLDRAE